MPKKVHGRPPAKARQRTRRPTTAPAADSAIGFNSENGLVAEVRPTAPVATSSAASGARPAPRPGGAVAAKRSTPAARKTPGIVINYHYLRRDIRTLGLLAPSMVVLLVIAFFVFR